MVFGKFLLTLLGVSLPARHLAYRWIADGDFCPNEYVEGGCCIDRSNCILSEGGGGIARGYPKICKYTGLTPVMCCLRNDYYASYDSEEDYSMEGEYPSIVNDPPPKTKIDGAPNPSTNQNTNALDRITNGTAPTGPTPSTASTARAVRIPTPYYRPSFQNSTFLKKCGDYFRQVPLFVPFKIAVVGGTNATAGEFPHAALLGYGPSTDIQWKCGGSLISEQYVLTAAHCMFARVSGKYVKVAYVRLGELDISTTTDDADVKDFGVQETIPHPLYRSLTSYHDIALIRMNATVSFNKYIRPICLATKLSGLEKVPLVVAGWGLLEEDGVAATILQTAILKLVPQDRCSRIYGTKYRNIMQGIIEDVHICADGGSERRDTCQGDSGGPLQYTNNEYNETLLEGFQEVVGVTSFGKGCGLTAGIYTRVLPYVPWIEGIVWANELVS